MQACSGRRTERGASLIPHPRRCLSRILLFVALLAAMAVPSSCKKKGKSKGKQANTVSADGGATCVGGVCNSQEAPQLLDLKEALEQYIPMHQRMLQLAADPATRHQARFVVFRVCCGELGNRLIGLASSLLFALVSQRALLIGTQPSKATHVDFINSVVLLPNEKWKSFAYCKEISMVWPGGSDWPSVEGFSGDAYDDLFRPWHDLPVSFQPLLREWSLPYAKAGQMMETIELNNGRPEPFVHVLCRDLANSFNEKVFVVLVTNQYFAPAIRQNAHHKEMAETLFKQGETAGRGMFDQLLSHIARPQKAIANRIRGFKAKHFKGKAVVGMQVRRQMRDRDKPGAGTSDAHVETYWECAETKARAILEESGNETMFFLATDHEATREEAKKRFGSRLVFHDAPVATSSEGMVAAMVDMWLLSECTAVVVTSGSTFGSLSPARYVGHARRSLAPLVVTLDKVRDQSKEWSEQAWEPPKCIQEVTSEPCFHVWPMMIPQECFEGGVQVAMQLWGQQNCRPWDMELFKFQ